MNKVLPGLRVLIVDDEWLVAAYLETILIDAGCKIVGPVNTVAAALQQIETNSFDVAMLDVNLHGEIIWPVVEALAIVGTPFVLTTGYELREIRPRYRQLVYCQKPYRAPQVLAAIERARSGGLAAEKHQKQDSTG